ncbi:hypothetical protein [Nocardia caishijiensis]|uniref:Lipoprotein n=1 Tax=Nocardia caishijiensis TaxID=184756 RepID=A0ABQ6YJ75_9NOCA|nr:hypothetical protein [Nocardia caishijiensis]KAF0845561.1 hypothetical protein FNL39_107162 [Nocardia caishijiensis]
MKVRNRAGAAVLTLAVLASLGATSCGKSRWCERDLGDVHVADSYCEKNTPGYEWEPDNDKPKYKKKSKKK